MLRQFHFFCAMAFYAAWLLGCVVLEAGEDNKITLIPLDKDKVVIKWDGHFKLDAADYYINGIRIETGLKGFDHVVKYLAQLNRSAKVTIESPKAWSEGQMNDAINIDWEFPFAGFPERESTFTRLCGKKSFLILFKSTPEQKK